MKLDSLPREKTLITCKLTNGTGLLTTHRLIIEKEKHNPRFNIMEKQPPEIYLLQDLTKTEIKGETLTATFQGSGKAQIQLQQPHIPEQIQRVKDLIQQAAEILRVNNTLKR